MEGLKAGHYAVVFPSPESVLQKYRKILRSSEFSNRLVAIAVDESHIIQRWGVSNEKSLAFRAWYGNLSEIRSLPSKRLPVIALTATATDNTFKYIVENLNLFQPVVISRTPEKRNLKYYVYNVKINNPNYVFQLILDDLQCNGYNAERIVVFCRRMKDLCNIYKVFHSSLSEKYLNFKTRPYAMFHSRTKDKIKDHILNSFNVETGTVRFLVATIAFGMGVDCKGLNIIIHYGPPANIEDYFQESGRAGRDGKQSHAIILNYPAATRSKHIVKGMKDYVKNNDVCKRMLLMKTFGVRCDAVEPAHLCCDVCQSKCQCTYPEKCSYPLCIPLLQHLLIPENESSVTDNDTTSLSDEGKKYLEQKLVQLRNERCSDIPKHVHCGVRLVSGFPLASVQQVMLVADSNCDESILDKETSILDRSMFPEIMKLIHECLHKFGIMMTTENSDDSESGITGSSDDSDSNAGEDSENSSDSDLEIVYKYRAQIPSDTSEVDD